MRQDYKTVNAITVNQKKTYLLTISNQKDIRLSIYGCMSEKEINQFMKDQRINKQLFIEGLKQLYNSQNYEELEFHLIMMNALFDYESYQNIKKQLFSKICKKTITINEYCVLRQLIPFEKNQFSKFLSYLNNQLSVDAQECARICLLEDEHHLAYEYLKELENCYDQNLLDLLSSYSLYEYTSLIRHYAKKKRGYVLLPSH